MILPIMVTLCLMLSGTYYAQNYAGIISGSLGINPTFTFLICFFIFFTPVTNFSHYTFHQIWYTNSTIMIYNTYFTKR